MIKFDVSPRIKRPVAEFLEMPRIARITDVNEEAVGHVREVFAEAMACDQPVIPLIIDSNGGEATAMLAIIDIIEQAKETALVATIVDGKAMSAGAVILAHGSDGYRFIGPNATVMVHQVMAGYEGKHSDFQLEAGNIKKMNTRVLNMLDKATGKKRGDWAKKIKASGNADLYFSSYEAVRQGIGDKVRLPTYGVFVDVKFSFA